MTDRRPLQYNIKWNVWDGHPITDIHFKNFELVIEFMWHESFLENVVYKGVGLHLLDGMREIYANYCRHILRNECSVMMLSEDETSIVAVGLLEWMTDDWHSWTFLPSTVPKCLFQEFIFMRKELMENAKTEMPWDVKDALVVQEVGFPASLYEDIDFQYCIFDVFCAVAEHMHMPRICYVALTVREQDSAEMAEYILCGRSIYSIYKVDNKRPFDVLRDLNEMYALLYTLPLEPIRHYREMPGFEAFHEELLAKQRKEAEEEFL